jgi:hypothetical protein
MEFGSGKGLFARLDPKVILVHKDRQIGETKAHCLENC